ncbi:hypothetical protein [Aquiflexum lacus]|uniref:hypothetical protein n=1 Tax=Aquiflexum lacus TaxID=2483805 RepID=UPI001895BC67|nr:hypothetical protein [Aquiflexum lacus]
MKDDKNEIENALNQHDPEKEIDWVRDKLIRAEKSGFTEKTREEILAHTKILDDRIKSHIANPTSGESWEVVKFRVKKQL